MPEPSSDLDHITLLTSGHSPDSWCFPQSYQRLSIYYLVRLTASSRVIQPLRQHVALPLCQKEAKTKQLCSKIRGFTSSASQEHATHKCWKAAVVKKNASRTQECSCIPKTVQYFFEKTCISFLVGNRRGIKTPAILS